MNEMEDLFDFGIKFDTKVHCDDDDDDAGGGMVDLTPYYMEKQTRAAKLLGMSPSVLSKRWRKASGGRMWPYRVIHTIDDKIKQLGGSSSLVQQEQVYMLLVERAKNLAPVKIPANK